MGKLSKQVAVSGAAEARRLEREGELYMAICYYIYAAIDADRAGLYRLARVWRAKADQLGRKADKVRE